MKRQLFNSSEAESAKRQKQQHYILVGNERLEVNCQHSKLFDYQKEGVIWMLERYMKCSGAILADDMGLGKTVQIATMIDVLFKNKKASSIMIIAPLSVISSWRSHFWKWTISLSCAVIFHNVEKSEQEKTVNRFCDQCRDGAKNMIFVTTFETARIVAPLLTSHEFDMIVLDEGHRIKNDETQLYSALQKLKSKFKLVVTGTPIQNNLNEIRCIFAWLFSDSVLGSASSFDKEYQQCIAAGSKRDASREQIALSQQKSRELRELILPHILRRDKSILNIVSSIVERTDNYAPSLPPKYDVTAWIYVTEEQERLYRNVVSDALASQLSGEDDRCMLKYLTQMKQICCSPALVKCNNSDNEDLEEEKNHVTPDLDHLINNSSKIAFLIKLLAIFKREGHRTLVFSQYKQMLDLLEPVLQRNFTLLRLDGSIRSSDERQNRVTRFNQENIDCFLLTSQVGGVGITLTGADRVVIFDPNWNPAIDNQSVDRAYRIGQTRPVIVYRLLTCSTIEEKIYRKQIFKNSLSLNALDQNQLERYFSSNELSNLFCVENMRHSGSHSRLPKYPVVWKTIDDHIQELCDIECVHGLSDHESLFNNFVDLTEDP